MLTKQDIQDNYIDLINILRHTIAEDVKNLSKEVGMSWPTVNQKIRDLTNNGILCSIDQTERRFMLNAKWGVLLGISIGVLDTQICILDYSFHHINLKKTQGDSIIEKFANTITDKLCAIGLKPTPEESSSEQDQQEHLSFSRCKDYSTIYRTCTQIIECALEVFDTKLVSVGVSLPGIIDTRKQSLIFSPNFLSLVGLETNDIIEKSTKEKLKTKDVFFQAYHDTLSATTYEKEYFYISNKDNNCENSENSENCIDIKNIATLYWNYGFGCSYIIQNRLLTNAAGEFGHVNISSIVNNNEIVDTKLASFLNYNLNEHESESGDQIIKISSLHPCACGNITCLERLLRIFAFNSDNVDNFIVKTTVQNLKNYQSLNPLRYNELINLLSIVINTTVNLLSPEIVILSGKLLRSFPGLDDALKFKMYESALKSCAKNCTIIKGCHYNDVTAAGAAVLSYYQKYSKDEKLNIEWE